MKNKDEIILSDGGLETDLIFNRNINLPHFAAFPLIEYPNQVNVLKQYYREYLEIAKLNNTGFVLETPTWRANADWGYKLGYTNADLDRINQSSTFFMIDLKNEYANDLNDIISGNIGPRGDGYEVSKKMTIEEAEEYHNAQIESFSKARANMVSAFTMNYVNEALGIVKAAKNNSIDVVISFTVELDGALPSGELLKNAILEIDKQTGSYPLYYMINCAHPSHFYKTLGSDGDWKMRIKGIRVNASCKSHAELDESTELDTGDKKELANWFLKLKKRLPELKVYGGCCGTDSTHIKLLCEHIV